MDKMLSSRVVIVDDMVINRMIIASLLASNGISSDQAESGKECLKLCEENDYDLILLDHRMPELDGVDTFIELKKIFEKKGKEVPVICHTIEEGRKNINLYKAAGFADVLIKPIDPKQLADVLMTYLPTGVDSDSSDAKYTATDIEKGDTPGGYDELDELDKLPLWLKSVPHIDLVKGLDNCGDAEDYIDALYIFYSSIDEKSEDIARFMNYVEWTMYKLSVHSLKSIANLVGARDLSQLALELEEAAKNKDIEAVSTKTPQLLESYRKFKEYLSPLMADDSIRELIGAAPAIEEQEESRPYYDTSRCVLYIRPKQGIVIKGIEKNLGDASFKVISVADEPDEIIASRNLADIILYHPIAENESHIGITMNLLGEICRDDTKILLLVGDKSDVEIAAKNPSFNLVTASYTRPVSMNHFIDDVRGYSKLISEYMRKKAIYIVDDDPDYTSIVSKWLSKSYEVSAFGGGEELMQGLSIRIPDLVLMDYEMPDVDGYELMRRIRSREDMRDMPVVFLTGKNDREHVFKILNYKPDGYLLKTSQKESLLDFIERFFKETMYRRAADKDFMDE